LENIFESQGQANPCYCMIFSVRHKQATSMYIPASWLCSKGNHCHCKNV